tara:strand:- start:692 stop:1600 length:909 start_codon:yes stop_codon:yes gene_type:complete
MFTSIVFSKDRPLQLDLCIKSLKQNLFDDNNISVLYKTSNDSYKEHYNRLKVEYPDINFVEQGYCIFDDLVDLVSQSSDYLAFFTDDDIVFRKIDFTIENVDVVFKAPEPPCTFSLRMGLNSRTRDYGDGEQREDPVPKPIYKIEMPSSQEAFLLWNRTGIGLGGYWSYPLSVDGHIFTKNFMLSCCEELAHLRKFYNSKGVPRAKYSWGQTPNEFESKLQRFYFSMTPMMASAEFSCVVNSPNNRVQNEAQNRNGDQYSYDADYLAEQFAEGKRIDLNKINFDKVKITCPHTEIDILEGLS